MGKKALAGLGYLTLTAGGDFHPALRTSAARTNGLGELWPNAGTPASVFAIGNRHVPMPSAYSGAFSAGGNRRQKLTISAASYSDSGLFSN
jgi:hypothetical protein